MSKLLGSDEITQLCSGFIKFIEEILLPISKQDTKQFQSWTKFKEIIDPFNSKKLDIHKIDSYLQFNIKGNQENKPPLSTQCKEFQKPYMQEKVTPFQAEQPDNSALKQITERICKNFHNNNTHLDILLKMNEQTSQSKQKFDYSAGKTLGIISQNRVQKKKY
ncbi:hypothetical protein pb186bvf_020598 [Paramecium bursaria]